MSRLEKIIGEYSFYLENIIGKGTGGDVFKGHHRENK